MAIQTTYTQARANLAKLLDEVTLNQEVVLISRRKSEDVALISASELRSILEIHHLLRSPKNAERLLNALGRAQSEELPAQSLEDFKHEVGIEQKNI
jgi:antitoxin YefM